ncbi:unnamed protein product, partial [Timema podura]|nr:unnamed protein product [Timema podura]
CDVPEYPNTQVLCGPDRNFISHIGIFEWWYFRKYGTSFIEQVSLNHISPWIGGGDTNSEASNPTSTSTATTSQQTVPECKVWRNPLNLLRGAEYQRFYWATNKEPLTYYDMNLSAQDHQTFFTCEGDCGRSEYEEWLDVGREIVVRKEQVVSQYTHVSNVVLLCYTSCLLNLWTVMMLGIPIITSILSSSMTETDTMSAPLHHIRPLNHSPLIVRQPYLSLLLGLINDPRHFLSRTVTKVRNFPTCLIPFNLKHSLAEDLLITNLRQKHLYIISSPMPTKTGMRPWL